jgi:hypothetical protein
MIDPQSEEWARQAAREIENERRRNGEDLERKAVALVKQYGFYLPKPAKVFFRELADFLKWDQLKKEL